MSSLYRQAIKSLVPAGTEFENIVDREGGKITKWKSPEVSQPSEEAIEAKIKELQAEYDSKQYQRDRLAEYPSIQECIHAILDDDLTALQAKRTAVKAKYPKPE
tara:strand:+ start:230 stop:541 length:312 start_codon:yes stop_codon:yes gene_type:complete